MSKQKPLHAKLLSTFDAKVWTEEFLKLNLDARDFGTMIGWFANAIMCGHDHAARDYDRLREHTEKLAEALELYENDSVWIEPIGETFAASEALAEYRQAFPKE